MLFVDYINDLNLNDIKCDGIIISSKKFSCNYDNVYDLSEIKDIVCKVKSYNLLCGINCDRIIEEFEIEDFYSFLDNIILLNIDYIVFSDISLFSYFKKHKSDIKLIYDSKTMITNREVSKVYSSLISNETICTISNEITLEDIKDIASSSKTMIEIYGHHRIFYSRRRVFDSYKDYMTSDDIYYESLKGYDFNNKALYIKEENRQSYYPIYQTEYGTFVHNSSKTMILEELEELSNVYIYRINTLNMTNDMTLMVVNSYYDYLSGNISLEQCKNNILSVDGDISKEFLYQKSILVK